MNDYEAQNAQVIGMVNKNHAVRPEEGIIVWKKDAQGYLAWERAGKPVPQQTYTDAGFEPAGDSFAARESTLFLAAGSILRATPALVFFAGVAEGLMDLRFATVCAICSLLWAVGHWMRG